MDCSHIMGYFFCGLATIALIVVVYYGIRSAMEEMRIGQSKYCNECCHFDTVVKKGCAYKAKKQRMNNTPISHDVKYVPKYTCKELNVDNKCSHYSFLPHCY